MPFGQRDAATQTPAAAPPTPQPESPPSESEPHSALGQTVFSDGSGSDAAALPFQKAPELTLEQYASLWAERGLTKDPTALHQRYQLPNQAAADALHASWRKRLMNEPGLKPRFDELVAQYRTWLQSQKR